MSAGTIHLVRDGGQIAERRRRLPPGLLVEVWPDLFTPGEAWIGAAARRALEEVGGPLEVRLTIAGEHVPVYYGPRLEGVESLPFEESLRGRVLSAHGIAAVWFTRDRFGERVTHEPASPLDPLFYLRRPGGALAHLWRLFRTREEARAVLAEHHGDDADALAWAERLPVAGWDELVERHGTRG